MTRAKKPEANARGSVAATVLPDELLDEACRQASVRLRSGARATGGERMSVQWPETITARLVEWLKTPAVGTLADLLRATPAVVGHPVVFLQLIHLRNLSRLPDEAEVAEVQSMGGGFPPDTLVLPVALKALARAALRELLDAFVRGLNPGLSVQPVTVSRRKGRPGKRTEHGEVELLTDFNDVCERLVGHNDAGCLKKRKTETQANFLRRCAKVVQTVHGSSRLRPGMLPDREAVEIVRRVASSKVSPRKLAYSLLAHYEAMRVDQMRGLVQSAEGRHSHLYVHRRS